MCAFAGPGNLDVRAGGRGVRREVRVFAGGRAGGGAVC